MNEPEPLKSDNRIKEEFIELFNKIHEDMIQQPANRKEGDFYETKQVFLERKRSEKEYRKWYDKNRHKHMKMALLDLYNNLNEGKEFATIEALKNSNHATGLKFPSIGWIELACHAAVWGIDELQLLEGRVDTLEVTDNYQDNTKKCSNLPTLQKGEVLCFEKVAQLIAYSTNNSLATARGSLNRQCKRRMKEINEKGLKLPQALYKKQTGMSNIYIVQAKDERGQYLFQRMTP